MGKLSATHLLSIFLLFLHLPILCFANNSSFGCFGNERDALLNFKKNLVDPSNRLSSWEDNTNCCTWEGVSCHITGHVVRLDLRREEQSSTWLSSTRLDSSLLELKYLNYLDLSRNSFNATIPTFLGSMKQLQHLHLSRAGFHGIIPHYLGNLPNLLTLDIGYNYGLIAGGDLRWISNLTSLEYLDLNRIDLSGQKDLIKVLSMLPSLSVLHLSENSLDNSNIPHSCVNSTLVLSHVKYLDLSWNKFYGEIPCFLHNMTSLEFLDLSHNWFNSTGQPFLSLKQLAFLDVSSNGFQQSTEWISELIGNNCQLKSLNLFGNKFHGGFSAAFKNLSRCRAYELENLNLGYNRINGSIPESIAKLSALVELDISDNLLSGSIPESIAKLSALVELDISGNLLSGSIPESIGKLSALMGLDISWNELSGSVPDSVGNLTALRTLILGSNQLSGELPASLWQLSNLEHIYMSYNSFNGTLSEAHFSKLSKLKELDMSSNPIGLKVKYNWVPSFQLESLKMSSCNMEVDQFPPWLQTQKSLTYLNLSNCSISGTLPTWLGSMMNLTGLLLSNNHISGPIVELPSSISLLDLSDNTITHLPSNIGHMLPNLWGLFLGRNVINGSLPHSLCEMKHLAFLSLSKNNLSGNLLDCWQNFPYLEYVGLSSNELSGIIPKSIGAASQLSILRLDRNHLIGPIPSTLMNCSFLEILDVGENKLFGEIPEWLGNNLANLRILRLRNNQFHGVIPRELCQASGLQILDLGINKLTGYIPNCFQNFSGMKDSYKYSFSVFSVNDSLNQVWKGVEMEYSRSIFRYLANLDLSCNNLTGRIPSELTALVGLEGLNLSHNNLHGEIPRNIGGLKLLESLDLSDNHLSGKIPEGIANLTYLSRLNLSNNNLSGQIPTGRQLRTLEDGPSIYGGNPLLCGDPLPKKCHNSDDVIPKQYGESENHVADTIDQLCFYAFVIGGFASGLWGFFGILFFKRSWRYAYFRAIEAMIMKMMGRWINW